MGEKRKAWEACEETRRLPKKDLIQFPVPLRRALQYAIEARGGGYGVKTRIVIEALMLHPDVMRFYRADF